MPWSSPRTTRRAVRSLSTGSDSQRRRSNRSWHNPSANSLMTDRRGLPFDDSPDQPVTPVSRPLTVSELTADIRQVMEGTFDAVAVEGEISNCRQWSSGHLYFTLDRKSTRLNSSHGYIS